MFLNEIAKLPSALFNFFTFNLCGKIKVKSIIYQIVFFVNRLYKSWLISVYLLKGIQNANKHSFRLLLY
ncbi:MAG: hypothetical protein QOD10_6071 [Mycobacterium sp.]|nr:hypothetical protein [Mycobacterium sp.]